MRTFMAKQREAQQRARNITKPSTVTLAANRQAQPSLHVQRALGHKVAQRWLQTDSEGLDVGSGAFAKGLAAHDFNQIPTPDHTGTKPFSRMERIQGTVLRNLRASVSRVTGTDVSAVPVETGDVRSQRAVTHQGRVTLGPEATEHDVAHELAHAAQQRSSSGAWLRAGEAERRADHVADAALRNPSASVAVGRVPGAAVLGAGTPYVREAPAIPPPPPGVTVKDLQDQLNDKVKSGDITSYSMVGVKAGDPEEKYLYNALLLLVRKNLWGSELDLVTSIGAGKGEVTVRIDEKGNAEVRLVGKAAPTVPAAFATVKDAQAGLIAKYKLAEVTGEHGKKWSLNELNKVAAAWDRLSAPEAAALEGYKLIRTDKLLQDGEPLQGQTTHTDEVVTGETTVKHLREIRLADSAFAGDETSFIGDVKDAAPASFETLIHEVGHALEGKPFDDLNVVAVKDIASANQDAKDAQAAQLTTNKAVKAALAATNSPKAKILKADATAGQPLFDAIKDAQKVLQAFEQSPDATNETAAKKAIDDRDAVKAKIAEGNKVVAALAVSLTQQDAYFAALKKLRASRDTATASKATADALKSGANTKRLQAFIDFVQKEKIRPPTAYAEKHWPGEPAEFFDEAFSLWKNDPVFFKSYSPKLQAWFDAGNHLK